jgi:putative ABC transport system permease protein
MLSNFLATAVRNLARNRAYSIVGIFGLALGLCAALCAALVLRDQLSYDRFIDGYERTYMALSVLMPQGRAPLYDAATHNSVAALLKVRFPEISSVARLADQTVILRHDQVESKETLYWADATLFSTLPLPAYAGDLQNALRAPNSVVLTRSAARKYFGRDAPLGDTLELDHNPMRVTAIIEDLPAHGTQLKYGIFASGVASFSLLRKLDDDPANRPTSTAFGINVNTFLRLGPGAGPERIQGQMTDLMNAIWPRRPPGLGASIELVRIDRVHLFQGLNPDVGGRLAGTSLIGALILLLACINFVNLATARSARRALEVSIRKACGAGRPTVMVQFLAESLLHVAIACGLAIVMAEWCLPYINSFLDTNVATDYWRNPVVVTWIVLGAAILGILAGLYPAFIVSAFRPAAVLRGALTHSKGASRVWQSLVVLQFAALIGLMIAAGVIYRQKMFATRNLLRVPTDQVLLIQSPCNAAFNNELRRLTGVRGAGCSSDTILNGRAFDNVPLKGGGALAISQVGIDAGVLELYGLEPVAGRFFRDGAGGTSSDAAPPGTTARLVINQTAVRGLGFASAVAAIGQSIQLSGNSGEIIGVVPDFSLESVKQRINPTFYVVYPQSFNLIAVNLTGRDIPETLEQIDRLWARTGGAQPIKRYFLSDYIQGLYVAVMCEAEMFGIFAVIAILLASLGLFALTASITQRRTKEIGIRKAMGAGTSDIVRLLVWQFTKPVLWANVIAWPLGAYFMGRWLLGFAYHTDLSPWLFAGSTLIAIAVAQLTVATHCYLVARSNPVAALRFE